MSVGSCRHLLLGMVTSRQRTPSCQPEPRSGHDQPLTGTQDVRLPRSDPDRIQAPQPIDERGDPRRAGRPAQVLPRDRPQRLPGLDHMHVSSDHGPGHIGWGAWNRPGCRGSSRRSLWGAHRRSDGRGLDRRPSRSRLPTLTSLRTVSFSRGLIRACIIGRGRGSQTRRRGRRHGAGRRGSWRRWRNRRWRRGRRCRRNWRWRRGHGWGRRGQVRFGRGRRVRRIRQVRSVGCVDDIRLSRGEGVGAPIVWRRAALDVPGRFRLSELRRGRSLELLLRVRHRGGSSRSRRRHADDKSSGCQTQHQSPTDAQRGPGHTGLFVDPQRPLPELHLGDLRPSRTQRTASQMANNTARMGAKKETMSDKSCLKVQPGKHSET